MKNIRLKIILAIFMALGFATSSYAISQHSRKADLNLLENETTISSQGVVADQISYDASSEGTNPFVITGESLVTLVKEMTDLKSDESIVFHRRTGQLFVKARPHNQKMVEYLVNDLRKSMEQQVVIEARFVEVASFDGFDLGVEWENLFYGGSTIQTGNTQFSGGSEGPINFANAGFGSIATTVSPATNFGLGYASNNLNIDAAIRGLAQKTQVNTLSSPKITCYNNQRANIRIEKAQSYIRRIDSDFVAASSDSFAVNTEAIIGDAISGVVLEVVPTINGDETITLELHPNVVSADLTNTSTINSGNNVSNSVTLPVFVRQSIDTTVTIQNGGTIVLGGLITNTEKLDERKVPILGDVPIIRHLFRYDTTVDDKAYLLVFISAKILEDIGYPAY